MPRPPPHSTCSPLAAFAAALLCAPHAVAAPPAAPGGTSAAQPPAEVLIRGVRVFDGRSAALSGLRSPYAGKLGVIEPGALADLLLVDGDPLAEIEILGDPARNFVVIMKDGVVHKNTLEAD